MYQLKPLNKCSGVIDCKIATHLDDKSIIRKCCEVGGLILIKGYCYGSPVVVDANGDRFALMIRRVKAIVWVEYCKLTKKQKLELEG